MKNPFVYIFAIPLYIIKFAIVMVATVILSFGMAFGMIIAGTDGVGARKMIKDVWGWFKKGIF